MFRDKTRDPKCIFCPSKRLKLYCFLQTQYSKDFYYARECLDCTQALVITKEDSKYLQKLNNIKEDDIEFRV